MTREMNILLLDTEKRLFEEFQEACQNLPITLHAVWSYEEAHSILTKHSIEIVIFALRTLADLEFLHYLNTAYQQIEVIVEVENPVREIVSILKEGTYRIVKAPVMPSVWRACVEIIQTERRGDCLPEPGLETHGS